MLCTPGYKAIWPTAGRDLSMVHRSLYLPNGHIWVISTSIEHPQTPVTEKYVRAKLLFAISHFEPLSASSCRVTYSVALNPMGNVPVFVVNLLSTAQPLCIAHVRKFIIDHPESLVIAQQLAAARRLSLLSLLFSSLLVRPRRAKRTSGT